MNEIKTLFILFGPQSFFIFSALYFDAFISLSVLVILTILDCILYNKLTNKYGCLDKYFGIERYTLGSPIYMWFKLRKIKKL